MKKKNFKTLQLNKKAITKFSIQGGKVPAETCEGPCQNGTGCCNGTNESICECYSDRWCWPWQD